jgi:ABC-2 type transport system permease protein
VTDHALEGAVVGGARTAGVEAPQGSWRAAAWRQFRLERRLFWRNPSAAFFNFILPLLLLGLFGALFAGDREHLDVLVPGIAGMSIMANTFSALAYNLVSLRERGVLKRMRGTPLPTSAYLTALLGSAALTTVIQLVLVIVIGAALLGTGLPDDWLALVVFLVAGSACFAAMGVALSHAISSFEAAGAYVNAVLLPMIGICGVFYNEADAPAVLETAAAILPLTHLIDGLQGAMVAGEGLGAHWLSLGVLAVWTAALGVLAVRGFSWDARRSG